MTTVGAWLAAHPDLDRRDREVLLCGAAGLSRAQVMARPERALTGDVAGRLEEWARRRRHGEPVAYILGEREFWGLGLAVTPAVLVPRPETELLVEVALDALTRAHRRETCSCPDAGTPRVLDLGTGSGAVAIAIAAEARRRTITVEMTATDVSEPALAVAMGNARRHGVPVRWAHGDWFGAVDGRYDLVVSNPPYVADDDAHLAELHHEPTGALVSGPDGLNAIRAIVSGAPAHLRPHGILALEHGFAQGPAVRELMARAGFEHIHTLTDLAGLERVSRGQLPEIRA